MIWKHIDWAMGVDQEKAVNVFVRQMDGPHAKAHFKYEETLDFLMKYETAKVVYLEHLIFVKRIEVSLMHIKNN